MTQKSYELLNQDGAARLINVKSETLAAWRHRRQGPPYVKIGDLVRYRDDQLHAWIEARTRNPEIADGDHGA